MPRGTQGQSACLSLRLRDFHPLWSAFPVPFDFAAARLCFALQPPCGFGLLPFRSPLLGKSFLFLWVLRCFSSPGSLRLPMCSVADTPAYPGVGFPIRTSSVQAVAHTSPKLIAVYRVLHRQLTPRHPPYALSSLSTTCDTEKLIFSFEDSRSYRIFNW